METVTLNLKEQKRLLILNQINQGKMNGEQAAEMLGLIVRNVRRMLAVYREDSARMSPKSKSIVSTTLASETACRTISESLERSKPIARTCTAS